MWCLIYQEAERRHLPPDSVSPFPLRPHPRARQVPPPREGPARKGPARTGEGARRPIQAPPTHLPRVRGAPSPSPQQSLQPPTVSPTTPSAGGPNWEDRSNHQNPLHGHSRRPPPSYGAAAAGAMLPPLVVSAVRACAAPAGPAPAPGWGPPPRLAGAPVCYRGGGMRCAPPRFAAARPHWALPRTNQPHLAGKAQGDDPRVGCMCGRDALSLTAAAGGRGVAARAGHKTDAGCRCVARTDAHVPTSLLQARVWPAVTRLSTDPRRLATAALHPPCHDRVVSIWLAAVRSHPPPPRKQRNRRVPWPVPATHCDVTAGPTDARRSIAAAGGTGDAPAEVGAEARHRVVRLQWGAARVGHPRAGTRHSPVGCGAEAGVARWRARPPPTTLTPDHTHHPRPRPTASGR